jgi:hypothetical protein
MDEWMNGWVMDIHLTAVDKSSLRLITVIKKVKVN